MSLLKDKQKEQKEKENKENRRIYQAGKSSLIDFSILTNRKYKPNWHHELIAEELEKAESGKADWKVLLLMCPPRSGKSELATINFPAWYLGKNPDKEIITASYSSELALGFGGKTRDIVSSPEYKQIFGKVGLKEDEQARAKWRTSAGGSYTSTGIGGALTGRGADILVIDDPIKNREEAESKLTRDKHWNWFTSTAYTRLQPNGRVIVILTRWHLDDLAGRLMLNAEFATRLKIMSFPAIGERNDENRGQGEALWPQRYDIKELESIKRAIGTYDFGSLFQQRPILTENQEFKREWIKYRTRKELEVLDTRNFITIDTAISKKDDADYTGITRNYVDRENKWNISTLTMRISPKELIDLMFNLYKEDRPEKIGVERTIYLMVIKPFLDDEMRKRDVFLPIVELEHKQTHKETRIRGLIPRYESKSIFHLEGECKELEDEMENFPKGQHDDTLDSLAYQLQIADAPAGVREERAIMEAREERNDNVKSDSGLE